MPKLDKNIKIIIIIISILALLLYVFIDDFTRDKMTQAIVGLFIILFIYYVTKNMESQHTTTPEKDDIFYIINQCQKAWLKINPNEILIKKDVLSEPLHLIIPNTKKIYSYQSFLFQKLLNNAPNNFVALIWDYDKKEICFISDNIKDIKMFKSVIDNFKPVRYENNYYQRIEPPQTAININNPTNDIRDKVNDTSNV